MPGRYQSAWLSVLSGAVLCLVTPKLSLFAMAETTTSPSEPFLGEQREKLRQERPESCGRCVLRDDKSFRSERNDKVRPLCLTSTALEYGGKGNGGATPSPLQLIRLADVIGAKASRPSQRERKSDGGEGGDVKSKRGNAFHKLEVFAYVVSGGDNVGCSSCVGSKRREAAHKTWLVSDASTAYRWASAINDRLKVGQTQPDDRREESRSCQEQQGPEGGEGVRNEGSVETGVERAKSGPGRRLLVLVNPVSGKGDSRSTWEKTLRPMLDQAMSAITVIFSTRGGELAELIKGAGGSSGSTSASTDPGQGDANSNAATEPEGGCGAGRGGPASDSRLGSLDGFDGIVVVGGDGTFFETGTGHLKDFDREFKDCSSAIIVSSIRVCTRIMSKVLQGLYARPDCARQLSRLSLGIVPAGSGNGLAKTVSEESGEDFSALSASFLVAKGHTKPMDLLPTESGDKKYLAFLNVGWGMISDVDIESEAYRWMGSNRFTFGTIVRIINLKHYRGRISFLPELQVDHSADGTAATSSNATAAVPFRMPPLAEPVHLADAAPESCAGGAPTEPWTSVEGEFILADVAQTSHISHDMPMAPHSRLGDGLMDLFFIKKGASRIAMIQMFLAMEKGEHLSPRFPCISWYRVRAFRIEPLTSNGRLTVDGELVDYAPLQQHVWRNAASVFCSPNSEED